LTETKGITLCSHTAFCPSITHIIAIRAEEEMIRPHTGRRITVVETPEAIRDRAIMQFIRKTMRKDRFFLLPENAISARSGNTTPEPAGVCLDDLCPEAFKQWANMGMGRKEPLPMVLYPGFPWSHNFLAAARTQGILIASHNACTSNAEWDGQNPGSVTSTAGVCY